MKSLYSSILIVIVALFLFAPLAVGADGHPAWNKQIKDSDRFNVLDQFGDAAVLDRETGRVWERSPSTTQRTWFQALTLCYAKNVGGRRGWRLPTIEELASLVDPTKTSPALPPSHPFTLTVAQEDGFYWSATTDALTTSDAWVVRLDDSSADTAVNKSVDPSGVFFWCVRGGQGIDGL